MIEAAVLLLLVTIVAAGAVRDHLDDEPEPYTPEHVNWLYESGAISLEEMEQREAVVLDDEKMRVFRSAQRVGGVGEKTAWNIAAHFDTEAEYRAAGPDEYEAIYGVGPALAATLDEATA